jgi:hypothetical protein
MHSPPYALTIPQGFAQGGEPTLEGTIGRTCSDRNSALYTPTRSAPSAKRERAAPLTALAVTLLKRNPSHQNGLVIELRTRVSHPTPHVGPFVEIGIRAVTQFMNGTSLQLELLTPPWLCPRIATTESEMMQTLKEISAERRRRVEVVADMLRENNRLSHQELRLNLRAKGLDLNRTQINHYMSMAITLLAREQIFGPTIAAKMFRHRK